MQEQIKTVVDQLCRSVINNDFNLGLFIDKVEQQIFQPYNFSRNLKEVNNILIIRTDAIGDYILTTSFIREIRKNYPQANITLIVSHPVFNLAKSNKYVDEVLIFDGSSYNKMIEFVFIDLLQFCFNNLWFKNNQFRQFDLAFSPQCGSDVIIPLLLTYLSGSIERIGFGSQPYVALGMDVMHLTDKERQQLIPNHWIDSFALTNPIVLTKNEDHEIEKYFYILKLMELNIDNTDLELNLVDTYTLPKKNKERIAIGIGSSQPRAIYDINKLNQALLLIGTDKEYIFLGGINDQEKMKSVTVPHINLVGQLSLQETASVISQCDLYIGNDTGLMHMAVAFKIPVIEISREAKIKTYTLPHVYSSIHRFHPWHTKYVVIQPDEALDQCKDVIMYGGCISDHAHCINQIKPEEIANAYNKINKE